MNKNFNIVVVGAGPVGITTACTIQALYKESKICVVDKRPVPTRNHGLRINSDSVNSIQQVLETALENQRHFTNTSAIRDLKDIFSTWSNAFIRTSEIENTLAEKAAQIGITVLRGPQYSVTEKNFSSLFESEPEEPTELQNIFKNATLVIGADGAHSIVRATALKQEFEIQKII